MLSLLPKNNTPNHIVLKLLFLGSPHATEPVFSEATRC